MKYHKMQQSKFGLPVTATGCTRHAAPVLASLEAPVDITTQEIQN